MKSNTGMTSTDICNIIKECGASNVLSIKIGNIEINFKSNIDLTQSSVYYGNQELENSDNTETEKPVYFEELDHDLFLDPLKWDEEQRKLSTGDPLDE